MAQLIEASGCSKYIYLLTTSFRSLNTELEQLLCTLQNTFLQITYLCRTLPVGCFQ